MTQPPADPGSPPFPLPAPSPPAPAAPPAPETPPQPTPPEPAPPGDELAELRIALDNERRQHRETRDQLAVAQRAGMTADQRRLDDARQEGRQAAIREAGTRVAQEAFRTAATGRFPDRAAIEAALEALNLTRFVNDAGEVDRDGIGALVDKLVPPGPTGPRIPAGAQGATPASDGDFIRQVMARGRG